MKMNPYIVFEGLDGSGKDTQLNKTIAYIRSQNKYQEIFVTREPSNATQAGKILSEKLKNQGLSAQEALKLFVEDRVELTVQRKIIRDIALILSSRSDLSTYAYQTTQGLDFDEIYHAHRSRGESILYPDYTFFFDVDIEHIEKRLANRGESKEYFEEIEFLRKTRDAYLESIDKLKGERNIIMIDANSSIDEVFLEVKKNIDEILGYK